LNHQKAASQGADCAVFPAFLNQRRSAPVEQWAKPSGRAAEVALAVGYPIITFSNRILKKIMGIALRSHRLSKMKIQKVS
jgi:hypothetical protein